jgi:hypothetical protein
LLGSQVVRGRFLTTAHHHFWSDRPASTFQLFSTRSGSGVRVRMPTGSGAGAVTRMRRRAKRRGRAHARVGARPYRPSARPVLPRAGGRRFCSTFFNRGLTPVCQVTWLSVNFFTREGSPKTDTPASSGLPSPFSAAERRLNQLFYTERSSLLERARGRTQRWQRAPSTFSSTLLGQKS